jgi:lactoylglutathione lyase
MEGVVLELTHNYGTEKDVFDVNHRGNVEKGRVWTRCSQVRKEIRGEFVCRMCVLRLSSESMLLSSGDYLHVASEKLDKVGCAFKKKPDDGRMKGLAFVYDSDGNLVEIVIRGDNSGIPNEFKFSQTMLLVKDPTKSLLFYKKLGMKLLLEHTLITFHSFSCDPQT